MKKHIKIVLFTLVASLGIGIYAQDVAVNVSGSVSTTPGSSLTYKIYVTNNGPSNVTNANIVAPSTANFTASSLTCANGPGNGASSVCPGSVTIADLQGSGLIIPSLPSGSAVVLTVTGTASSTPGNIAYTATVTSGGSDPDSSNNTVTLTTQIASNVSCGQSTYTLNLAQTASTNSVAVNGGTIDLVYTLTSGTAIPGLGSSFTVPVTYSDLNSYNGTNHQWHSITNDAVGLNLGMATYNNNSPTQSADPGSIYNGMPISNIETNGIPNLSTGSDLNIDNSITTAVLNGDINSLGLFTLNFGNPALPSGVRILSKNLIIQGRGSANGNDDSSRLVSGYLAKPIILNTIETGNNVSITPEVEMEFGQTYTWRYTAFYTTGLPKQHNRRGVVFKNGSITFAYNCPCNAGTEQVELSSHAISNYTSNLPLNDELFFHDFGSSPFPLNAENNFGRMVSPYMPTGSFTFGTAYPNSTNSNETAIDNNHYAVVAPGYIKAGWKPGDLGWYFWTPAYDESGTVTDRSGTQSGAVMAINAGNTLASFYQRDAVLQMGASYKASFWIYVKNATSKVAIDVIDKHTGEILGAVETDEFWSPTDWTEVSLFFSVPVETESCKIRDVIISFRNDHAATGGNDYYVDDIRVEKTDEAPEGTEILICPSVLPECSTSGSTSVNLNSLFTGTIPSGLELLWFDNPAHTGTAVSDPENVSEPGTYYAFFFDSENNCYNTENSTAVVVVTILEPCDIDEPDTDGDGIPDVWDQDDDNDGILDIYECSELEPNVDYAVANGNSYTFTAPGADLGFVFDIYTLDNSFNLNINGVNLATNEIDFQFNHSTRNIRFADGSQYGTGGVPEIWSMTGNSDTPLVRIIIGPNGAVSMFGCKATSGPLFPLELFNGTTYNTIIWNTNSGNDVTVTQQVDGQTYVTGHGTGYKKGFCDLDGDGISNELDLDSDGDGCPDAIEGSDNVENTHLNSDGSINIDDFGGIDENGVPIIVNSGGSADIDGHHGQNIGNSQNSSVNDCPDYCVQPGATAAPDGFTKVGISTMGKQTPGWPQNIPNGWITLESPTKGFVISRVAHVGGTDGIPATDDAIFDPKEGMLVYDIQDACVKLFNGSIWNCIERSCNTADFTLNCSGISQTGDNEGPEINFTITVPYSNGDGSSYTGQSIASTGLAGLTAILEPGTLANGSGTLTLNVTGIVDNGGVAYFILNINGVSCLLSTHIMFEGGEI